MMNKLRNGQALPLNTIVIALLVVIVLVVVVLAFTGNIGTSTDVIKQNAENLQCTKENPALQNDFGDFANLGPVDEGTCSGEVISSIPTDDGQVCCAYN